MRAIKYISFIIFTWGISSVADAQIPVNCFEIESILVDACGNPEGENEMVRFKVGPNPLNTADLTVNWPNNSWLGVCQNAQTANSVAQLNATIAACGFLLEPVGGILPPGADVILVSSTNFSVAANSFSGLSDTIYIIFQCQGNTAGHFANATGSGIRNLTLDFGGCNDQVSYSCQLLTDINGNTGVAGSSADRDGAAVVYDWSGNATYVNNGCNAPYIPLTVDAGVDQNACIGDTILLSGTVSGSYTSINWTGGMGTWVNTSQLQTSYIVGAGDINAGMLVLEIQTCNGVITDTVRILQTPPPQLLIHDENVGFCYGGSALLDAGPGGLYLWSTGATSQSINVNSSGTYYVNAVNSCGSLSDTVFFYVTENDVTANFSVDSISGDSPLLVSFTNSSIGANAYQWQFGNLGTSADENPQFTFLQPGNHLVILTASNGECNDTATVFIHVNNCESQVYIPTAFTPNADEINQEFYIKATCSYRVLITIFDRWGNEVHSWNDIAQGWSGLNTAGNVMPVGVYVYLFELEDLNGIRTTYRGVLNLIK